MGLAGARNSAVTGLQAQSTNISITADNISNASTQGYKAIVGQFSTLVTNSGSSLGFSSGGVSVTAKDLIDEQGLIEATGRDTDLALSGDGFFSVEDADGTILLTRAGAFDVNSAGELVNAGGFKLLGWPLDDNGLRPGEVGNNTNTIAAESTDSLQVVDINAASGLASATSSIAIGANMDAGQNVFQGATATIDFNTASNSALASTAIIAPLGGLNIGDNLSFSSNNSTSTFEYGGVSRSRDLARSAVFGASAASTIFSTGANLADNDAFTITTTTSGTVTFTFTQSAPDTNQGEFNSLDTLATAINNTSGLSARVQGTQLLLSSTDANDAMTFADVNTGDLVFQLGFSDMVAGIGNRFNTLDGLEELIDSTAQLNATVLNASSNATLDVFGADPELTLTVSKAADISAPTSVIKGNPTSAENGEITEDQIIVPIAGTSASTMIPDSSTITIGAAGGTAGPFTYGGFATSNDITNTAIFGSSAVDTAFSAGFANLDDFQLDDGANTHTITYVTSGAPNTAAGEFDDLTTLAAAIDADANFTARIVDNTLHVSAADATLGIAVTDPGGVNTLSAAAFSTGLGFGGVAWTAAAANRFNTLSGLSALVTGAGVANLTSSVSTTGANAEITITDADGTAPQLTLSGTTNTALLDELGLSSGAVGDQLFTEFGLNGTVDSTEIFDTVAVSYDSSNSTKNMAGGNVTPQFTRNIRIFDSLGTGHDFRMAFLKTGVNEWAVEFYALNPTEISAGTDGQVAAGTVNFNGDGTLASVSTGLSNSIQVTWNNGAEASSINLDLGTAGAPAGTNSSVVGLTDGLRQFDSSFSVDFVEQNGVAAGLFSGIEVNEDGTINARFTNGESKAIYQLPIANVANPNGLIAETGNVYSFSSDSGEINLNQAGTGGAGEVVSGALEGSTADIAEELTKTIGIQSNYNANATLISTVKDMEEELNRRL